MGNENMLTLEKFEEASEIVKKVTLETKLVYSDHFSRLTGNRVYLKPENMQFTGAYKVRGAYYKISTLTDEERAKFDNVVGSGLVDTFRHFYPDLEGAYSWWSYRFNSRAKNAGWRIDYFVVSESLLSEIEDAKIYSEALGSDHCPVGLILK